MQIIETTYKWAGTLTRRSATRRIILHHMHRQHPAEKFMEHFRQHHMIRPPRPRAEAKTEEPVQHRIERLRQRLRRRLRREFQRLIEPAVPGIPEARAPTQHLVAARRFQRLRHPRLQHPLLHRHIHIPEIREEPFCMLQS